MKTTGFKRIILSTISGVLLALSYPSYNLYLLQWFAFLPILFALNGQSIKSAYFYGLLTGFWGGFIGFYWVANWATVVINIPFPINFSVTVLHSFLVAQIFGVIFALFQWIRKYFGDYDILTFPVIFVTILASTPTIFKFSLGDAQSYFLPAIQLIEFTGVYGLDFIIILTNITIFKILNRETKKQVIIQIVMSSVLVCFWFSLGWFQLQKWEEKTESWEQIKIGIVQSNKEATVKKPKPTPPYTRHYPMEMALSEKLASQKPEVIIWPEGNFFGITFWKNIRRSFRNHISELGIPIILHDITVEFEGKIRKTYNSSILIPNDKTPIQFYHKRIRVPFGEYVPFIDDFGFLQALFGDFLASLDKGESYSEFKINNIRILPVICYESLFPDFVAGAINRDAQGKILLVQSQDGWYGHSSASEQHLTSSVLRAVENRVPLIHVINNGASGVVSPSGQYEAKFEKFKQVSKVVYLHFNATSGGSYYSRHPNMFLNIIRTAFVIFCVFAVRTSIQNKSIYSNHESENESVP